MTVQNIITIETHKVWQDWTGKPKHYGEDIYKIKLTDISDIDKVSFKNHINIKHFRNLEEICISGLFKITDIEKEYISGNNNLQAAYLVCEKINAD